MPRWIRCAFAALLATAAQVAAAAPPDAAPLPPPEAFFAPAALQGIELSPSGRWLAVKLSLADGRFGLGVYDLTGATAPAIVARFRDLDIRRFDWVNDERLVFDTVDLDRASGDPLYNPGLFSIHRDGSQWRTLVKPSIAAFVGERASPGDRSLDSNHLLECVPAGHGDEVVILEWRFDASGELTARVPKRLNVVTGRVTSAALGAPAGTKEWVFDTECRPRLAVIRRGGRVRMLWHADPAAETSDSWAEIGNFETNKGSWTPYFVDSAGQLYVAAPEGPAGVGVLKRFDFAAGRPADAALVSTPGFDYAGGIVTELGSGRLLGIRAVTDAETTVWLDPQLKALQEEIDRRLPGRVNRVVCRPCGGPELTAAVTSWSDRDPEEYRVWRGELAKPVSWRLIGPSRSGIDPRRMATLDFDRYKARDGRSIPVWVTTPPADAPGLPAGGNGKRAAVLLVHGGPWVRDGHWAFDPMAQFLASRGYVVIEPEYRGSTGYGWRHFRAGWKQWGRAMQDDLADAVAWAGAKGIIDPSRVCIAGASYGGYATLMGLVRDPGVYRCGVAWVAVAEPALLLKWTWATDVSDEVRQYALSELLADPVADAALLREISPVVQAARIKAPLLLAYGGDDHRVPLEHGKRMRAALQAAGNDPEYVVYEGEGHGFRLTANKVEFARRVERFLARNLH